MPVETITPGKTYRVGVGVADYKDILEYAEAGIEQYGWVQGRSGDTTQGFSLHGAIGWACTVLSDKTKDTGQQVYGGKDAYTKTPAGEDVYLRAEATNAVIKVIAAKRPTAKTPRSDEMFNKDRALDISFNDKAKSVDEILAVLREARGA